MFAGQVEYDLHMFFFKNQTKDKKGSNLLPLKIESSVQQISSPNCCRNVQKTMAHPSLLHSAKAVLRFYMAADVVLVASLNEVLPLVICESMAFERPVVCSDLAI